jgi:alkanesulfonate monooxygenase SsuD/methylene tetrahydromethanopterin reductase-like flavin-dependent oxidoreductase (luciferase family)
MLNFGLGLMLPVERPWTTGKESAAYTMGMKLAELADRVDFDQVWLVEHHFLEEYSHCSAQDLFLAALAQRTQRIRLGRGIAVCLREYNHPVQLAERSAVLDILSGGRLELGTGRAATWTELGGFRVDPATTKESWDEFIRELPKIWLQERYSYEGRFFSFPERAVLPKPVQQPHPPLWVAVSSEGTELDAADRGLGWHGLSQGGLGEMELRVTEYRRRIQHCEPVGAFVNEQVNFSNFLYCHEDPDVARTRGQELVERFLTSASWQVAAKDVVPSHSYRTSAALAKMREMAEAQLGRSAGGPFENLAIGTPDHIIEVLRRWEGIGVDRINFSVASAGFDDFDLIARSMELFAKEVMPAFRAGQ